MPESKPNNLPMTYSSFRFNVDMQKWICDLSGDKPVMTEIFDSSEGEVIDLNLHYDF